MTVAGLAGLAGLELRGVAKRFGDVVVVHPTDLTVAAGEFLVLLGESGCGKSTTLRMVAGLESVSEGRVHIGARDVTDLPPMARDIAMVFQSYALYPHMDVARNMSFALELAGTPKAEVQKRVADAARILDITHLLARKPKALSGGQRQRVAIGRAIVREPQVFLFDEPLSNLDAKLRGHMRGELALLHARLGKTTVYVTHDQVEAMTLATRIAILDQGRVQQLDTPAAVFERPANRFVAGFVGTPSMNLLAARVAEGGVLVGEGLAVGPGALRLPPWWPRGGAPAVGQALTAGLRPQALRPVAAGEAAALVMQVDVVEYLGTESQVGGPLVGAPAGVRLVATLPGDASALRGTRVGFTAEPQRLHLFDAAGGASLRPPP